MNKNELIDVISKNAELTKKEAAAALDATIEGVINGLVQDGKVQLVGFGSFEVRTRTARVGRNPRTGESLKIEASRTAAFKPGKDMREAVNGKK